MGLKAIRDKKWFGILTNKYLCAGANRLCHMDGFF